MIIIIIGIITIIRAVSGSPPFQGGRCPLPFAPRPPSPPPVLVMMMMMMMMMMVMMVMIMMFLSPLCTEPPKKANRGGVDAGSD